MLSNFFRVVPYGLWPWVVGAAMAAAYVIVVHRRMS